MGEIRHLERRGSRSAPAEFGNMKGTPGIDLGSVARFQESGVVEGEEVN